ncbi:MAG: hypothetical protein U9N14_02270 [Pseudomonadota bacterium]|nr:hypothetical protein [Pseudomonadota bacterium]
MSVKNVYIFKEIDDFVITRDPSNNKIYLQFFLGFKGVVVVRVRVVSSEHGQKLIKSMRNVVKDKLVSNAEREFAEILKTPIKKESKKKSDEEEEVEVVIHGEKSKKTPAEPTVIDEEQRDNELKRRRAMELDKLRMMKEEQDRMIEAEEMRLLDESSMGEADAGESAVTEPGENDTMEAPTSLKTTESLPDEIQQAAEAVLKAAAERRAMRKKNAPDNPELTKSDKNQDQTA